jgi:hypothetical protein
MRVQKGVCALGDGDVVDCARIVSEMLRKLVRILRSELNTYSLIKLSAKPCARWAHTLEQERNTE